MSETIFAPIQVKVPKNARIVVERNPDNTPKRTIVARFSEDFVIGNLCASAQFFGTNLARRRIGHKIASLFRGKNEDAIVTLPRDLAAELWKAASESDYSSPFAAQLPEEWLWAIPETEALAPAAPVADTTPPEPNPAQDATPEDNAAAAALVAAAEDK